MSSPPALALYPSLARPAPAPGWRRLLGGVGRAIAALVIALATVIGGIGWLYLLRRAAVLDAGPRLPDALGLQRLAGGAAQPALCLAVAWLPAGVAGGLALRAAGFRGRIVRPLVLFVLAALLLVALGAAADAITASEPLRRHLGPQPHHLAIWVAALLVAVGAALPGRRR